MNGNHKGKLKLAVLPPTEAAHLKITAFTDRPPVLESTVDLVGTRHLLSTALAIMGNTIAQVNQKAKAGPVEDKPRGFLGPRE